MFSRVNVQCLLTLDIQKQAVDSNLVCLFKNRWSQCPRYWIWNTLSTSMPIPGRSSRSRRRWSTSWRSTICPTASTATGRAVTAATGWPDIGVSLQAIYLMVHSFPSGENYPRLLAIKASWDPGNVFNHCQSVGSTDNSCCPFTLSRPQGPPPPWNYSDNRYSWHLT